MRMITSVTRNTAITFSLHGLSFKSFPIPGHVKITIVNNTLFLIFNSTGSPQHIIYRSQFHPILNGIYFRTRSDLAKRFFHPLYTFQMLPAAYKKKITLSRIHSFYNPFQYRPSLHPDKRLQFLIACCHKPGTISSHRYNYLHILFILCFF